MSGTEAQGEWVLRVLGVELVKGNSLEAEYNRRIASLTPDVMHALRDGVGDVGEIRAVADFAREKAGSGAFDAALKALDTLEKLLTLPPIPGAENISAERFGQLQDTWLSSKQEVHRSLTELHAEIIAEFDDPESTSAANNLARILARFDQGLGETMRRLREASDASLRGELAVKAGRIAGIYLSYLAVDPLVAHVEANPYEIKVAIKDTLSLPLTAIRDEAAKLAVSAH